jgi:hypothetical protein
MRISISGWNTKEDDVDKAARRFSALSKIRVEAP